MITDYTTLKAAITLFGKRADITTNVALLIQLAETQILTDLSELLGGETTTTLHTVAQQATLALPTDYGTLRKIVYTGSPANELKMVAPGALSSHYPLGDTGVPLEFAVVGLGSGLYGLDMRPIPAAIYALDILYTQVPAALSVTASNWLLTAFPDVYLYGALAAASAFSLVDERVPLWAQAYSQAVAKAKERSVMRAYPANLQMTLSEGSTP